MIGTVCPNCEEKVSFSDNLAGSLLECPSCGGPLQVPDRTWSERIHAADADSLSESDLTPMMQDDLGVHKPTELWKRRLKWLVLGLSIPSESRSLNSRHGTIAKHACLWLCTCADTPPPQARASAAWLRFKVSVRTSPRK